MKGVVFNYLAEMVEEQFGLEAWDSILQTTDLSGEYISSETYPDEELITLVNASHEKTGIDKSTLIRSFGQFMLPSFREQNPQFFENHNLKSFLLSVDRVIHVEVRKLHPDAALPKFDCEDESDSEFTMYYSSPRMLCYLAEGLIAGAAEHFNARYELDHAECMHDGADRCKLKIQILD